MLDDVAVLLALVVGKSDGGLDIPRLLTGEIRRRGVEKGPDFFLRRHEFRSLEEGHCRD